MKKQAVETWVVLHDIHFPKHNQPAFGAALEFLKENKVSGLILGGDQFDNQEISHHTKGKPLYRERAAYKRNTDTFNRDILKPIEAALPKDAPRIWIIGNHDDWEYQFIEEHPEFEGQVERPAALDLAERGWQVVPLGHAYKLGKLNVIHGEILTGIGNQAGMYPSRKAVELYGASVLAGHTHNPQSYTKVSPVEHTQKHMGWIAPCMCDVNPSYLRNRATSWLNGFTVVELHGKGLFNVYPCITVDGACSFGGKVYGK